MKKRFLTLLLALCCTGSSLTTVFAANTADVPQADDTKSIIVNAPDEDDPQNYRALHRLLDESVFGDLDGAMSDEFGVSGTEEKVSYYSQFNNAYYQVPSGYNVYDGIDVSYHNGFVLGTNINWKKVANDGVDFAFIRIGYRGYGAKGTIQEDKDFAYNIKNAKANGIPVGIYFFSQATSTEEAIVEADYTIRKIKQYGYSIDLPVVMDYEFTAGADGRLTKANLSKSQMTANALAFCQVVEQAGYQPMVYANKSFLNNNLDKDTVSSAASIWLANYTRNTTYIGNYDCWQYSDGNTSVNGIQGPVDCNFYFKHGALLDSNTQVPSVTQPQQPETQPEPETQPQQPETQPQQPETQPEPETQPQQPDSQPEPDLESEYSIYSDVYSSDWYSDAISYVSSHGIMTGTGISLFEPNIPLTRAMVAQIMYSLSGKPAVAYSRYFADVLADDWFSDAIIWAKESNVMAGYGDTFGVCDYITREDFATTVYGYSKQYGINISQLQSLDSFTDTYQVSEYALVPLQWAASNGLITGRTETTLAPKDHTTRAECATILKSYLNGIGSSLLSE